jgi:hypothetical protein
MQIVGQFHEIEHDLRVYLADDDMQLHTPEEVDEEVMILVDYIKKLSSLARKIQSALGEHTPGVYTRYLIDLTPVDPLTVK